MRLVKTRVWKSRKFIGLIIKEILDPWPIIKNSPLFILYDKEEPVSYCTVKDWGTCLELGSGVTPKKLRRKGYGRKLLKEMLKNYKNIYVVCKPRLGNSLKKFGFKRVKKAPYPIKQRTAFVNFFIIGKKYIVMKH